MMPMEKVEILRACCCVTGASGETSEKEYEILKKLASEVGVGQASLEAMIERGETDPLFYREQFKVLKSHPDEAMRILIQSAICDGLLATEELVVLRNFGVSLGMAEQRFQEIVDELTRSL